MRLRIRPEEEKEKGEVLELELQQTGKNIILVDNHDMVIARLYPNKTIRLIPLSSWELVQ